MEVLTADMLLVAYANGYFPMALDKDDPELYWFSPEERGVLPITGFNIPRGLQRAMKKTRFEIRVDTAFDAVIKSCGTLTQQREDTWINDRIIALYNELHRRGCAHSVESWQDGELAGGLYGVSIGGAFFGESMFSRKPEASKVALVSLIEILKAAGYELLDTQYVNDHLKQFGVEAWSKARYKRKLEKALAAAPDPSAQFMRAAASLGFKP